MGSANGEYPMWRAKWSWDELVGGWWGSNANVKFSVVGATTKNIRGLVH
jgi:hypothetical protein